MIQAKDYHMPEQIITCPPTVFLPVPCFTTTSCFSSTSCSCSPPAWLIISFLGQAGVLLSSRLLSCSCLIIWLGGHSCLPDSFFSSPHHCLLSLLCSSQSHLNSLQTPQQQRTGDDPTALPDTHVLPEPPPCQLQQAFQGGSLLTSLVSKHQYFSTCLVISFHRVGSLSFCHLPSQAHSKPAGPTGICLWGGFSSPRGRVAANLSQPETKL